MYVLWFCHHIHCMGYHRNELQTLYAFVLTDLALPPNHHDQLINAHVVHNSNEVCVAGGLKVELSLQPAAANKGEHTTQRGACVVQQTAAAYLQVCMHKQQQTPCLCTCRQVLALSMHAPVL
jgi:hypothetical protein